jgi:hypothetical protein
LSCGDATSAASTSPSRPQHFVQEILVITIKEVVQPLE